MRTERKSILNNFISCLLLTLLSVISFFLAQGCYGAQKAAGGLTFPTAVASDPTG